MTRIALCSALAVCALATASMVPAQSSSDSLALAGPGRQTTLSLAVLKAMPHTSITITNGHTHVQETYSGVPLIDLLAKVGAPEAAAIKGNVLSQYIVVTGSDNYHAVLSLAEVEPCFHPGKVLVADSLNGKPIDTQQGPLKLVVEEDLKPARSVRNLVKLELRSAE